jgi:hypothetical protein
MMGSIGKAATTAGTLAGLIGLGVGFFWTWFTGQGLDIKVQAYAEKYTRAYCESPQSKREMLRAKLFTTKDGNAFLIANCSAFE